MPPHPNPSSARPVSVPVLWPPSLRRSAQTLLTLHLQTSQSRCPTLLKLHPCLHIWVKWPWPHPCGGWPRHSLWQHVPCLPCACGRVASPGLHGEVEEDQHHPVNGSHCTYYFQEQETELTFIIQRTVCRELDKMWRWKNRTKPRDISETNICNLTDR